MKPLLLLVIVLAVGRAYYEWNQQQQQTTDFKRQRDELTLRLGQLNDENEKLQTTRDSATENLSSARAQTTGTANPAFAPAPAPATNAAPGTP